jgi:SAM-dependent methyltransferase
MERNRKFEYPSGDLGIEVALKMNDRHEALYVWGLSHVNVSPNYLILDVGCGGGKMINKLAHSAVNGEVFGIDHSKDMVSYSKLYNAELIAEGRVEVLEETVEKISFPDNLFDLVTAVETYYYWPNFAEVLQEIKRVLKPNGKFLLVNELIKDGSFEIKNAPWISKIGAKLFTMDEIKNMMKGVGFVGVKVFTHKFFLGVIPRNGQFWNSVIGVKQSTSKKPE